VSEDRATRLRRLRMRSMRRGIKEMDLILSRFAESALDDLAPGELDLYDALLEESDQDLYQWVSGQAAPPARYAALTARIARQQGGAPLA